MKKQINALLLLSCISLPLMAEIDERKSDLFYANGMGEGYSYSSLQYKWRQRALALIEKSPEAYNNVDRIGIAYNTPQGSSSDFLESVEQVLGSEWGFSIVSKMLTNTLTATTLQEQNLHDTDLAKQVQGYKDSIQEGHAVIVLGYSQGNLFTNESYNALEEWMQKEFFTFSLATPATYVAGYRPYDTSAPYIKYDNDIINAVPFALPANYVNPNYQDTQLSVKAHYISSYLEVEAVHTIISDFFIDTIKNHTLSASHWKADKEYDKNTMAYQMSVKHKYDESIVMDEFLYPFDINKKLYKVNNEWVKASAGGTNIVTSWDSQQSGEYYMLEGTGELISDKKLELKYEKVQFVFYKKYANPYALFNKKVESIIAVAVGVDTDGKYGKYLPVRTYLEEETINNLSIKNSTLNFPSYLGDYDVPKGYVKGGVFFETSNVEELKEYVDTDMVLGSTKFHFTETMYNAMIK